VIEQVPAATPVAVTFNVGPDPLAGENVAIVPVPGLHVSVSVKVPA